MAALLPVCARLWALSRSSIVAVTVAKAMGGFDSWGMFPMLVTMMRLLDILVTTIILDRFNRAFLLFILV
jgi:hypothetical protein